MTDPTLAAVAHPLRVLLVDSDDRVRESLARLLRIGDRCLVVASAGQAGLALDLAAESAPDIVVVDLRLPGLDGGEDFVTRLRAAVPGVRILVLNWTDGSEAPSLSSGADGYIRKTFRPHELIDAVVATARRQLD